MADFYFRDDIQAEKDRQAQAPTLTAPAPVPQPAAAPAQAPAPQSGNNPYAAIGAASVAPKTPDNPFDAFRSALDAQDPFKNQIKQGVSDTLANPAAAADETAGLARDRLAKSQQVEAERRRQQAGQAYGGAQTGQVGRAMDDYATEAALQTQDAEGQLRADRLTAIERNRNAAIGQGTQLIGQDQQAKLGLAQLASNEKMQDKQISSQEKMTFAGLDLEKTKFDAADANAKQGLSLEANAQALTKLGMDRDEAFKYASLSQAKQLAEKGFSLDETAQQLTKLGMSQEDARYYAGLASQEKLSANEIASREKLTYAQIGSTERLQATQQIFQGEQAKLDRSLQSLLSNDRIQAEFKLAEVNNTFQEKMQANGFVQEKDIEAMRADLQKSLQDRGISADQSKQIADQKFAELMAGRDQAFEEKMTNLKQTWASGERVSTQDWQSAMQASDQQHQELLTKLQSTLRLDEAKNAQAFQTSFQQMQNDFTMYRDQQGYSHEDATRMATEQFTKSMQDAGFTHDEAMQGTQLAWQAVENDRNRASTELMSAASLAQQDSQFMQELQQRYSFNEGDLRLRATELGGQLKLMGLQGQQLEQAMGDAKVQSAMNIAALGMEIGDGSTDSMAPFVDQLGTVLESYFKANGVSVSSSDIVNSLTPKTGSPTTNKAGADAFSSLLDKTGSFATPEAKEAVRTYAINVANAYSTAPAGTMISGVKDIVGGGNMDAASKALQAAGMTDSTLEKMVDRNQVGEFSQHAEYSATPAFIDFTLYNTLVSKGMDPASAKQALTNLIGSNAQRLNNALALIKFTGGGAA